MADIEKVIEALQCRAYDNDFPCSICAYYRKDEKPVPKCDYHGLMDDAIELLKEQKQEIWELQDLTEHLKDKLKEKKKPIEDFGMFAYKKHFKGELSAENLAFINLWISKYMEQS